MYSSGWLDNVRPYGGAAEDIWIEDGRIAGRYPAGAVAEKGPSLASGGLLLPSLVESHVHLDKTLWGQPWHSNSAGPNLSDYIANERRVLRQQKIPVAERASALLEQCIVRGSLAIRCHVDVGPDIGLSHVEAMLSVREAYQEWVDIQFVAFPQTGLLTAPGTLALMDEALAMGVDLVGGLDPCGIEQDPIRHLDAIFNLAAKYDKGLDIHLHDKGELGLWQIERILDFTERFHRQGRVMISHGYCLGMTVWERIRPLAERLARLEVSVMSSAPADTPVPPFLALKEAGVNLCLGSDGIRDAWSPMGNGDMLERSMLLAYRFDLNKDEQLRAAFDAATLAGARALGLERYGLEPGCDANLMLLPAETVGEVVVARPLSRTLLRRGQVIARDGELLVKRKH